MVAFAYYFLLAALIFLAWYFGWSAYAGYRAGKILRLVELALAGEGRVIDFKWLGRSKFALPLRLDSRFFTRAICIVEMAPRQHPARWIEFCVRGAKETVTFQADLGYAPAFDLDMFIQRWWAESRRKLSRQQDGWDFFAPSPFAIASKEEWESPITAALSALIENRCDDLGSVAFSSHSPNFTATLPLAALPAQAEQRPSFFDTFRALAYQACSPHQ
jgi:hypothetical protein